MMLDRRDGIIEGESELQHRITMMVLPPLFKFAWTEEELKDERIKEIYFHPVPCRVIWSKNTDKTKHLNNNGMVYAHFKLHKIKLTPNMKYHYYYKMMNFEDVLNAINGN
jgi:hypothetical protein